MDERLDPEMRAAKQRMDAAASELPPVTLLPPIDASRAINDRLNLAWAEGGPTMHSTVEHWVFARGRRVLCRMHRPTEAATLPVLIWFHGGGWVWSSLDTHDRLVREYAAASGLATINVDYALSPEAKFPQALLECADVRHGATLCIARVPGGCGKQRVMNGRTTSFQRSNDHAINRLQPV